MTGRIKTGWFWRLCLAGAMATTLGGCAEGSAPDATVHVYVVGDRVPNAAQRRYIQAAATALEADEGNAPDARIALERALEAPGPQPLGLADPVRFELLARWARRVRAEGRTEAVVYRLQRAAGVDTRLPLDRATAEVLIELGDAAAEVGDDALAVGSYARSIRVMSMLRQEATP